jgi:hypothetical protein
MPTVNATLPRVSRSVRKQTRFVQRQIVTRIPMRRARARSRVRTTRNIVVLTAVSLGVAGVAAATAYAIARRFAAQPVEERPGQIAATAELARAGSAEVALDGTHQVAEVAI